MADNSFNIVESIVGHDYKIITLGVMSASVVFVLGKIAEISLKKAQNPLIPDEGFSIRNIFEGICIMLSNVGKEALGKENKRYLPFVASIFLFVLVSNLIGLLPGMGSATVSFPFNLGLALTVFCYYNYLGIKESGLKNYLKHFWGPFSGWLAPFGLFLFMVELISHAMRPVTLSIRLYGNILGEKLVMSAFTDLTKVVIPVIFYFMGLMVCFLQAFVFTILTMVYIKIALTHEEDSHSH